PEGDAADIHPANWWGRARVSFDGRLIVPGIRHEEPVPFNSIGSNRLLVSSAPTGLAAGPAVPLPRRPVGSWVWADGRPVAAGAEEERGGWLSLHDVSTGKAIAAPARLPGSPRSVAARPSSPHVAVLCAGGELLVFDRRSGERVLDLNHNKQSAPSRTSRVEYTPDGATLVPLLGGDEDAIPVPNAKTG